MRNANQKEQTVGIVVIRHLDLGNGRYIENDKVIDHCDHKSAEEYLTWDELWSGVKSDIDKIRSYFLMHKTDETDFI